MSLEPSRARLTVRGVRKTFGATVALDRVDFDAAPAEVHALVGENGAGKSTLMKVLAGTCAPDAGEMVLDGEPYRPVGPQEARRRGIAMVYQELSLAPHLTVRENVWLGQEPTRGGLLDRATMRSRTARLLADIGHPEIEPDDLVGHLSPAARQITEIARALAQPGCRVLILDEPTSSLAVGDVDRLFEVLDRLRRDNLTIIYISHVLEEVQRIADRFTVLRDGVSVGGGRVADASAGEMVRLMAGRRLDELFPRSPRQPGGVVLTVRNLAGVAKPQSASLELRRGEVLGIGGLVGAGRTELLRAIFGLDPVVRGDVTVAAIVGASVRGRHRTPDIGHGARRSSKWTPAARLRQGVGFLSEDRKGEGLALPMSVADNVTLSRLEGLGRWRLVLPARQRHATTRWVEALNIRCADASQAVSQLSGGNQQKVALARLLHHDVDVLLLDEPTRGIDVASKAQIYKVIDRLANAGKSVLLVSSYLPELLGICDRIAMMSRGTLRQARGARELDEHQLLMEATGQA
ncbi:MAG: sugar ABC transporter ATP-binding protein [Bacteroidales bacterium]